MDYKSGNMLLHDICNAMAQCAMFAEYGKADIMFPCGYSKEDAIEEFFDYVNFISDTFLLSDSDKGVLTAIRK